MKANNGNDRVTLPVYTELLKLFTRNKIIVNRNATKRAAAAVIFAVVLNTGCAAGNGENLDANGQPVTDATAVDAEEPEAIDVSAPMASSAFGTIQSTVFTPICSECHGPVGASAGLRLDEAASFAAIVGVTSSEVPALTRIAPGDPDNSYLIQKLEGTAAVGAQMPLGGPPLPQDTIDFIRQWVSDGALPDSTDALALAPRVTSMSIENDASLHRMPDAVSIVWTSAVDSNSFNEATVSLLRSGGDGSFNEGNESAISVSVAKSSSPYMTTLLINDLNSIEDTFQLRITGEGDVYARGTDANNIDGDGNGLPGGNFIRRFTIKHLQ